MRFKNGQKVPDEAFTNDVYPGPALDNASTPGFKDWRDKFAADVKKQASAAAKK